MGVSVSFGYFGVYTHIPYYVIPSEAIEPSRVYLANGNKAVCAVCTRQTRFGECYFLPVKVWFKHFSASRFVALVEIHSTRLSWLARDDKKDDAQTHQTAALWLQTPL